MLNIRWLAALGTLSYALYLLHATVLMEVDLVIHSKVIAGAVSLFIAILLAYLVHIFVEKPTDAMRKRFRHNSDPERQAKSGEHQNAPLSPAAS